MPIAVVCAAFDADSDRKIAAVRALIRSLGGRAARTPSHRPHLTLSAASVQRPGSVVRLAAQIAKRHRPFQVRINALDTFGRGDVVWIGPARTSPSLGALHRDTYDTLIEAGLPPAFAGQSDPGNWRPHCTIARRMAPEVLAQLRERFEPFTVRVDALATIVVGGQGDVGLAPLGDQRR